MLTKVDLRSSNISVFGSDVVKYQWNVLNALIICGSEGSGFILRAYSRG